MFSDWNTDNFFIPLKPISCNREEKRILQNHVMYILLLLLLINNEEILKKNVISSSTPETCWPMCYYSQSSIYLRIEHLNVSSQNEIYWKLFMNEIEIDNNSSNGNKSFLILITQSVDFSYLISSDVVKMKATKNKQRIIRINISEKISPTTLNYLTNQKSTFWKHLFHCWIEHVAKHVH